MCIFLLSQEMICGIGVALRPVLCDDVGRMIQNIVYQNAIRDRQIQFTAIHNELLSDFLLEEGNSEYGDIEEYEN